MAQSEARVMDIIQIYDETLFGNSRYNKVGLVEQVQNINQQITILQNAPESYDQEKLDVLLLLKANVVDIVDSYSKTEDDALLLLKAEKSELIDSYSKSEDDALLLLKANVADLNNYVDLTSAQTISGQKQFGIISVSSISKQSKNDASILLAGGGDMLISSIVTQPQLQEVRDIATGKSKAYVFSTQGELNDWMAIQDNVAKLVIGDNLYIVDKEVTDYWWDGTDQKVLETELHDMSNVITTFEAATGSGNAISDISIDGNTLTPTKNTTFVTSGFDQFITGMKTFTSTFISNGIQYSVYDNNSAFLAEGGIKSITDIQSASYSKSETYARDEADKTQLIDSYTKTETNNLSNDKADNGVSFNKSEDDALLLLMADKTQPIDSYSKSETYTRDEVCTKCETDNLLNNKADTGVSYTKGEDDTLLFAKADKTQLIDSYSKSETYGIDEVFTKTETNNLLNDQADAGVSYSKSEDYELLVLNADKTQLIDSYTKGEADNLLNNKANQSTTYTKIETDQLINQIEVGDVDLSGYMTLGTSQTISANKTFNNVCRFVSSIDGLSTVTGSSFVKSGADDTVVLFGAGGTKPISEFAGALTDLSNYYTKTQTYSQTEANNKFVRFEGSIQKTITGKLNYVSPFDYQDETQDPVANTYLTMSEVDDKLTNIVTTNTIQSITGAKTFNANVSATGFVKADKDDTSVLLAGGGDRLLSSFGEIEDLSSSAFSTYGGNYNAGTFNPDYLVIDDTAVATFIPFPNNTIDKGGCVMITHSTGLITLKSNTNTYIQCVSAT
ncbi:MAG: hypothetical protein EZS28_020354 [Streblomastix strix]|uniref:Uncharacterized protein n=1 Tax=Streblomastix strix TaxID=222440 RepID=A0A5J4VP87_9EUKA|nr:MAG: hypothetical protein EZS28_020354 [Streblomastix strix]